jgi:poly(A)-specific ribonuclease
MEVNQNEFRAELREILKHASNASYVTFDLEMSGIHQHSRFSPGARGHDNGKPSIQELYDDTKIAAETYQVLQMGITFIEEDREKGKECFNSTPFPASL